MAGNIFDNESNDRVKSPERLDEYIRVASPGIWLMVIALILIFVSVIVWGFVGTIPVSMTQTGAIDGMSIGLMVDASKYNGKALVGKEVSFVTIDGTIGKGSVESSSDVPFSSEELKRSLNSDFLSANLISADYSYVLNIKPEIDLTGRETELVEVTIITDEVKPISFLMK